MKASVAVTKRGQKIYGTYPSTLFIDAEDQAGTLVKAWKETRQISDYWGEGDFAVVQFGDAKPIVMGQTGGDYNVLVTPDAVFWVDKDCRHYWRFGSASWMDIPIGPTTQGMAYWNGQRIVWMDELFQDRRPIDRRTRDAGYSGGLDPDADRVLAEKPDGSLWVVANCYTPVGAKLKITDDGPVVAISLPTTPVEHRDFPEGEEPFFVYERDWTPYTPPAENPLPPLQTTKKVWTALCLADPNDAGNATWGPSSYTDPRPIFEGCDWLQDYDESKVLALLFFAKEWTNEGNSEARFTKTVDICRRLEVPVILGWDEERWRGKVLDWAKRFKLHNVEVIPGVRCYPGDDPAGSTLDCIEWGYKQVALITPVYPQAWPQPAAEISQLEADRLIDQYDEVVIKLAYGKGRPGSMWSRMANYWQAQEVPAKGPDLIESVAIPPPPPLEKPADEPVEPVSPSVWERFWKWLKTRFKM